ncbi:MAG: sugar transferase [Eggerthellaceae bacterium]|jgi:lipopolysaccharide/colanic/teichoic acid biosynthesis glycosyltransferase|nr:sugar transferase [Eggerthellaceae bacterium]MCH4220665.1 sugar transferase [Eggerthellaceae bacterium]
MAYQKDMVAINNGIEQVGLVDKGNCGVATSLPAESTDGLDTALRGSAFLNHPEKIKENRQTPTVLPDSANFDYETSEAAYTKPLHYRIIKRSFDIVFSLIVIIVAFLPSLILLLFITIDTKTFPIYCQERVGQKGPFRLYKFRSMVADSDNLQKYFSQEQMQQWRNEYKVESDPRITKLGSLIRRTSIDELPQFINVLLGQISIIGPRCITEDELRWFGSDAALLLSVPQGITGAWQIGERNNATFENGTRQDIELNYCRHASIKLDVKIFFSTFAVMFIERSGR